MARNVCGVLLVLFLFFAVTQFASALTIIRPDLNVNRQTTTTLPADCETVKYPSPDACAIVKCADGYTCKYVSASSIAANIAYCKCLPDSTTTTTLQTRCEAVKYPSANACTPGLCPEGYSCKYVPSNTVAANLGSCKCTSDTTTTTLQSRCEAVSKANEKTCMAGICPEGYDCTYVSSATAGVANVGYCKCVSTTTTTLQSELRCEAMKYPSANTCTSGVCPEGAKCRYVASTTAVANIGYCKCVYETTTTTLGSQTPCEKILKPSSASTCDEGACPQGTKCVFKPKVQSTANLAALSPSGEASCVCVEYTTTTTLYPRCEDISSPSGPTCKKGLCPPNTVCRLRSAQTPALTYVSANVQSGCYCVPCDCPDSTTTTTIPEQLRCERVSYPSANACEVAKCPEGQKCKVFTAVTGNTKISKCACVGEVTTTTQPSYNCDGLISGSQEKCSQASCPSGYKCKYYSPASAASVGSCKCVSDSTPTTLPDVDCEKVVYANANSCEAAKCPAGQKCTVFTATYGNGQVSKCICAGGSTTTTLPQEVLCEQVIQASANTCASAKCPEGLKCAVYTATYGSGQVSKCVCMPPGESSTTTTLPKGLLASFLKGLFG